MRTNVGLGATEGWMASKVLYPCRTRSSSSLAPSKKAPFWDQPTTTGLFPIIKFHPYARSENGRIKDNSADREATASHTKVRSNLRASAFSIRAAAATHGSCVAIIHWRDALIGRSENQRFGLDAGPARGVAPHEIQRDVLHQRKIVGDVAASGGRSDAAKVGIEAPVQTIFDFPVIATAYRVSYPSRLLRVAPVLEPFEQLNRRLQFDCLHHSTEKTRDLTKTTAAVNRGFENCMHVNENFLRSTRYA